MRQQPRLLNVGIGSDERPTPDEIFTPLHQEFRFTIDVAADNDNAKCERFYTMHDDGLSQDWSGEIVWCNPPYSETRLWVEKAKSASATTVMLLPVATDVGWFHDCVLGHAEIRWVRGRIKFSGQKYNAPFASMIVIFRNMGGG